MTWLLVLILAAGAFALAAFAFRLPRQVWAALGTALMLGLAGFALQARTDLPGAPAQAKAEDAQLGSALIEARQAMFKSGRGSPSAALITADAFARHGQYANAVVMLNGAVAANPRDAEAWLALGNALVEHADGALTPPALLAYRRAQAGDPAAAGPGYFLGLALIRQGRMDEASQVWRETLASAAPDAAGRAQLQTLLARLDQARAAAAGAAAPAP